MNTIDRRALIEKICFNIEIDGIKYKDVCIKYDKKDRLTLEDIHYEDNNSWHLVKIGDATYDFQIYGDDDGMLYKNGKKNPDNILRTRLSIQLYEMYENQGELWHSSNILCNLDKSAKITYVRIDTNKGRKFCNLL